MRAWAWLDCVRQISGKERAEQLDSLRFMKTLSPGARFRSVLTDGFDPDRVSAQKHLSLLDFINSKRQYSAAIRTYRHELWEDLAERKSPGRLDMDWATQLLKRRSVCIVTGRDERLAEDLGLRWPEFRTEEKTLRAVTTFAKGTTLFEDNPTLDEIRCLLILSRQARDAADAEIASHLDLLLYEAAAAFGRSFRGEASDTWQFLIHTRMLRWNPAFEPSAEAVSAANRQLTSGCSRKEDDPVVRRGRPRLVPDELTSKKSQRRWRRQVWAMAAANESCRGDRESRCVGLQLLTPFNDWLTRNREEISRNIGIAMDEIMGGNGAECGAPPREPTTLEIPVDEKHHRSRPLSDPWYDYAIGPLPYDRLLFKEVPIG